MALGRIRFDTRRFGSAENKPDVMACTTSGWTPAVSTNRATGSFLKLLTQCVAGIAKRLKFYIYLTDVSPMDQIDLSLQPWEAAFGNSRWFTRWLNTSRAYRATIGRVLLLERQSIARQEIIRGAASQDNGSGRGHCA
jgi:hypothetical protein